MGEDDDMHDQESKVHDNFDDVIAIGVVLIFIKITDTDYGDKD